MSKKVDIEDKLIDKGNKERKKSELSLKAMRQIDTLKHYFTVDEINRIVTVPVHYQKASDLFDYNFSNKNHPYIKKDFLRSISETMHSIPREYLIDVDIKIDDYENYEPKIIIDSIKDAFEIFHYDSNKERNSSHVKVAFLIFIGISILAGLFYLCSKKLIGQAGDPTHDTVHELIYTVGAVVLWEAVYIIFLPDDEYKDISYYLLYRMNNIRLLNIDNKVLSSVNKKHMSHSWKIESKKDKRARYFLLLAGTTLMCLSVIKIRDVIELIIQNPNKLFTYIQAPISLIIVALGILSGIGAVNYYRDRGPFKKLVLIFGVAASIFYIVETITFITFFFINKTYDIKAILSAIAYLIVMILYTTCAFMLRNNKIDTIKRKRAK